MKGEERGRSGGWGKKRGRERQLASGPSDDIALPSTPLAEEKGHWHCLAHRGLGL